ncbi:MAG: gas vesicle protein GvpO [Pseudomonadota bacterium]
MSEAVQVSPPAAHRRLTLIEAMSLARQSVALFTDLPVDAVVSCKRHEEGWRVILDVVEAAARLGDNDLLATYEMMLNADGDVETFERLRRYHREDMTEARP